MHANQVTEFKYITLFESVPTKQWHLDQALDVARVRVDYEKLLPKQRKDVESLRLCIRTLSSWLQEELLSWLPFDRLHC